jgi:hypothetical protein
MKCTLCGETIDPEHPLTVRGVNPETNRKGWMHGYCFVQALDELRSMPSDSPAFVNRWDEYETKYLR